MLMEGIRSGTMMGTVVCSLLTLTLPYYKSAKDGHSCDVMPYELSALLELYFILL
jgi:hypothetical protein